MSEREPTALVQLKVRMREHLRAQLEESANEHGESLNNEVVSRLERSFMGKDLLADVLELAYGRQLAGVLMMLGEAMKTAGQHSTYIYTADASEAQDWVRNPNGYAHAVMAAQRILQALKPSGERKPPRFPIGASNILDHFGTIAANGVLKAVSGQPDNATQMKLCKTVQDLLGFVPPSPLPKQDES